MLALLGAGCSDLPEEPPETANPSQRTDEAAAAEGDDVVVEVEPEPELPPQTLFAKRFVVPIRTGPSRGAGRIGYLRAGAVVMAKAGDPIPDEPERRRCRAGWFELTSGGFVCNGRDVLPFEGERLPMIRAEQPTRDTSLPYRYGFIRNRVPQFRRIPTGEDFAQMAAQREERAAAAAEAAATEGGVAAEGVAAEGVAAEGVAAEGGTEAPVRVDPEPEQGETGTNLETAEGEGEVAEEDEGPTLETLQGEDGSIIARYLMRGFFVSLDREFNRGGRRYWRTQANGFVPHGAVLERTGSEFVGVPMAMVETPAQAQAEAAVAVVAPRLPYAWTLSSRVRAYRRTERGAFRTSREPVEYHEGFAVLEEVEDGSRTYVQAGPDRWFRSTDLRVARQRDRRPRHRRMGEVGPEDKWLDVNLASQTIVAYEGDTPVYATLVSSGKRMAGEEWETLTGLFRVKSKHLTDTMDGDTAVDGPYSVDDVPYVMYFELAYALHSAFWHNGFGRPRSHGCVNLSPLDARWVFEWADPPLPENWHSVYPTEQAPGTWIWVHGDTATR